MTLDRRYFLKVLGALGVTSVTTDIKAKDSPGKRDESTFSFLTNPYLQNFTDSSITIFCIVSKPAFARLEIVDEEGVNGK